MAVKVWLGKAKSSVSSQATGDDKTREVALRNNNPGNIRSGKNSFKTFGTMKEGFAGLTNQLDLYKSGRSRNTTGRETLLEMMKIYAPSSDNNNPTAYAKTIAKELGISINDPISGISTKKWAAAISKVESPQAYKELKRLGLV
tara:strand:- start:306 stop:737 length:432 start_codon:yes stop_codon:yes gene_type:complete